MDTTRRKILLLAAAVLLLGVVLFAVFSGPREPSYHGRSLSEWLAVYADGMNPKARDQATVAIRNIGTNGIPYYLKWIQYEPPSWKTRLCPIIDGLSGHRSTWMVLDRSVVYANVVPAAFQILGPQAKGAIPELARIINSNGFNSGMAQRAAVSLTFIGKDSLPIFEAFLTCQFAEVRAAAPVFIVELGTNALTAVPALVRALDDKDYNVRNSATNALLKIAPEALTNAMWK